LILKGTVAWRPAQVEPDPPPGRVDTGHAGLDAHSPGQAGPPGLGERDPPVDPVGHLDEGADPGTYVRDRTAEGRADREPGEQRGPRVARAIALGAHTRDRVSEMTGYRPRTVGNLIPQMFSDLRLLDAGMGESEAPMADVVSYASKNWEFFLDDTLRARYP
jgi:hypothetical protein